MSDIDVTLHIPLKTDKSTPRVTRTATTSDDSSARQHSPDKNTPPVKKISGATEKPAVHETAVTISTRLSNLEVGSRISATYLGIDGQDRPLIESKTGTYTVKYALKYQPKIDKIPRKAILDIIILNIGREIEAQLVFRDPTAAKTATISLTVMLELTSLGDAPPKLRTTTTQNSLPPERQNLSYQATDLYRAGNTARESASKLKELPLPVTTTNYTLYEQALPQKNRPAIIRSAIAGNAVIAQEQITPTASKLPGSPAAATKSAINPPTINTEQLLHKNILATVIKIFPQTSANLPDIIQKDLGPVGALKELATGGDFTLRINSIAVPDSRPAGGNSSRATATTGQPQTPVAPGSSVHQTQEKLPGLPQTDFTVSARPAPSPSNGFYGIIIAPGENIPQQFRDNSAKAAPAPGVNDRYPGGYRSSPPTRAAQSHSVTTLYVATPVSVIKFQSPLALKPGTVINFSLTDHKKQQTLATIATPERISTGGHNQIIREGPVIDQPLPIQTGLPTIALTALPPQPLESFVRNWQSLSQILSVVAAGAGNSMTQVLTSRLPAAGNPAQMTTSMIFFLAALGAKTPAKIWLGPDISQLLERSGGKKLLAMLDNDMKRIFKLGATTSAHDWRPALLPLYIGNSVNAIPILTRQVRDDSHDGKEDSQKQDQKENITRFIVELDLSRLGQIQLDGLLNEQKLNIIIRSGIKLPPEMKHKMTGIFTTALDISGYSGDLQFNNKIPDISVKNIVNQKIHMMGL